MLLVLWQAPRQRSNQLFALITLDLVIFGLINLMGRFVDIASIGLISSATIMLQLWLVLLLFLFVEEFADLKNRWLRVAGIVLAGLSTAANFAGLTVQSIQPSSVDIGGFAVSYTLLGNVLLATNLLYVVMVLILLRRATDPRPKALFPAIVAVTSGALLLLILRPLANTDLGQIRFLAVIFTLPYNSLGIVISAIIMGRAVLKFQLFDPMYQLNRELDQLNKALIGANRLKSQFLANISHELRTPLNSIIAYTELMLEGTYGPLTEKQQDRLSRVARNGNHLLALINDLLDINQVDAGRMEMHFEDVDSTELVNSVLATVEPLSRQKGLALTVEYGHAPAIAADKARAQQILINIVSNAIKFTHKGGITIRAMADHQFLRISIQDTGIGIPKEVQQTIFDEFWQVDNSTTRQYEGSGLGLAISKRLVSLQGGRIEVESTVGVGSTFHVLFPLADVTEPMKPISALEINKALGK